MGLKTKKKKKKVDGMYVPVSFRQLVQSSIAISLPASLSREKCESNVIGKGRQMFARIELAFTKTMT
jgi:hypothetical protein